MYWCDGEIQIVDDRAGQETDCVLEDGESDDFGDGFC